MKRLFLYFVPLLAGVGATALGTAGAATIPVRDAAGLRSAVAAAKPGDRIELAPGDYTGGLYFSGPQGTAEQPIVIAGADPKNLPRIVGGRANMHFARPAHFELRDLILIAGDENGLNIDDGGRADQPAHHVVLRNVHVSDTAERGNRDGIKLSGVDDFRVEGCTVTRWGAAGQGIDMVGCHRGVIEGCTFRHQRGDGSTGAGVQAKGGSSQIVIRRNRFEEAGSRAVCLGGSTGMDYFRPKAPGYEAKDLTVEGNTFVGSAGAINFVGVDGSVVRFNTIYHPGRWAVRILQETTAPGFATCRNGVFTDNIIVFRSDTWRAAVSSGPNTAPETFTFARNVWFCEDRPAASAPALPAKETDGIVGKDPLLRDPEKGDFALKEGSPAAGRGSTGLK